MKTRAWFHFHLSTALALMMVIGGLMYLNLEGHRGQYVIPNDDGDEVCNHLLGWPFPFSEHLSADEYERYNHFGDWVGPIYLLPVFFINMGFACGILVLTGCIAERHARRHVT